MSFGSGPRQSQGGLRSSGSTEEYGLIGGERTVPGPQTQGKKERMRRENDKMC